MGSKILGLGFKTGFFIVRSARFRVEDLWKQCLLLLLIPLLLFLIIIFNIVWSFAPRAWDLGCAAKTFS